MRLSILGLFAIVILAFTSCQKNDSKINDGNSDAQLIEAIQKAANKQIINVADLPSPSKSVLETDYVDDYIDVAKLAPELGYEVDMRCEKGPRVGEHKQAYFDLKGRELRGDKDSDDKGDKGDKSDKDRICFEFEYPVTFIMPDRTEIPIDGKDDEEGWGKIKAWYEAHPDSKERPALDFPVDIKFKDGTIVTVNNNEEMRGIMARCDGDKGDKGDRGRCFELILPVTFTMPDGSEIIIEEREDYMLIREWYTEHPDVNEKPALNFPVDIKYKDGTVVTINNEEEMKEAREDCRKKWDKGKRCFELTLPITYIMPDGSEIVVENKEDRMLIREWYAAHPDVAEKPALDYPVDIKYFEDATVVVINNEEEMREAREGCRDRD